MHRRDFLRRSALAGAGLLVAGSAVPGCSFGPTFAMPEERPRLRPLPPPASSGVFRAAPDATLDLGLDRIAPAWGYNGLTPGPLVRVRRGGVLDVELRNRLEQPTTIHWHGLLPPADMDGHPADAIPPGASLRYHFPIRQRAALHWYHPHPHHRVAEQVYRGLAGAVVVEDAEEDALDLPRGPNEHILVLRDAVLTRDEELRYRSGGGVEFGDVPIVNGVAYPWTPVTPGLHRLRLACASLARMFEVTTAPTHPLTLIGNDGGLLEAPHELSRVTLGPGERVDLLLDLSDARIGDRVDLRCARTGWSLLEMRVTHGAYTASNGAAARIPTSLPGIEPLSPAAVAEERVFRFEGHNRINGIRYALDRSDFTVPFGRTERWIFQLSGGAPHPIHVHGAHFQVESRRGGRGQVLPWEGGWKDTVLLNRREEVSVLVRFDAYRGRYLLHCHRLQHEDGGMMLNFDVV